MEQHLRTVIALAQIELETGDPREALKILRTVTEPDARPKPGSYDEYAEDWPMSELQCRR